MLLREVASVPQVDNAKLLGLVEFLAGRAEDEAGPKQISQVAFMKLAQQLGINITAQNLGEIIEQPPLSNVLEPLDPASGIITFKGGEQTPTKMPVDKAQDIVSKMAKRAEKKSANPLGK